MPNCTISLIAYPASEFALTATRRDFYGWATPNSHRVSILLEELGLPYTATGVNIRRKEQFAPAVLRLNPYGKIPVLVEHQDGQQPVVLFESGAILQHLAETHGRFLPPAGPARAETLSWLMVVLTALGPYTGQAHHWTELAPEPSAPAREHSIALVRRVYALLEARLAGLPFLAGEAYSIVDIAAWPWIMRHGWADLSLVDYPNLARWSRLVGERPAVQRGIAVPAGARLE